MNKILNKEINTQDTNKYCMQKVEDSITEMEPFPEEI